MSESNTIAPTTPAPRTEAQRDASRRNGALSHGPFTPMGKANSARNALTHGLTSKSLVLDNENPEEFEQIVATYRETFHPTDPFELDCVQKMAYAKWREHRIWIAETATLNMEMNRNAEAIAGEFQSFDESIRVAHALEASLFRSSALHTVDRLEARYSRMFRQGLRDLREHRKNESCKTTLAISNKTLDLATTGPHAEPEEPEPC